MSIGLRLAGWLIDHASAVMPADRKDWADAMRAEFAVMPTGRDALAWASGCVWASYMERIDPMNVFVKSLLRAAAVWSVVLVFIVVMILVHPLHVNGAHLLRLVRLLSMFYGGMFATLWICELLIARYWTAPGQVFKKTLLRTTVLWLWPFGMSISMFVSIHNDPVAMRHLRGAYGDWLKHWLWNWVTHYPVMFVAIFVPLLICEWLMVRYWRTPTKGTA